MTEIKDTRYPSENSVKFEIKFIHNSEHTPESLFSKRCHIGSMEFYLRLRFNKYIMYPTISVLKLQQGQLVYEGVLLELKAAITYCSLEKEEQKSYCKTLLFPNNSWELDKFELPPSSYYINMCLIFNFIHPFNLDSSLVFSFTSPSKTPLFRYLNNKGTSDCCFQLKANKQDLWVRKDIITFECPFFEKMLLGEWSNNLEDKINAPWSDKLFLSCILHLYTGWLPGSTINDEVLEKLKMNKDDLKLGMEDALELYEIAKMIELYPLAHFSLKHLNTLVEQEQASLMDCLLKKPIETNDESL
ncbi:hypothetical protein HMI56_005338 [Coelomomyces lativittatus]|nr:hypothetical protein HMI56_005338 [Coelomomyces lativittatus]